MIAGRIPYHYISNSLIVHAVGHAKSITEIEMTALE